MKRWLGVILAAWLGLGLAQAGQVRVLLGDNQKVVVSATSQFGVWNLQGQVAQVPGPLGLSLQASGSGINMGGRNLGSWVGVMPQGGLVRFAGRNYRGRLRIVNDGGRLLVINEVPIEDYLRGVLPGEVPASFPLEALKAQAVSARTYTLAHLGAHKYYDICATAQCQVYKGADAETPVHNQAVEATGGLVLGYGGKPIDAVYHADSGGRTASAGEVWGRDLPYLAVRDDPFTISRPWSVTVTPERLAQALAAFGVRIGPAGKIEAVKYSPSGRITRLRVAGSAGTQILEGNKLTRIMSALGLPSTQARFSGNGPWVFSGRGNGHGVGMSQWGARGFAMAGWNFASILAYYYPGTQISGFRFTR